MSIFTIIILLDEVAVHYMGAMHVSEAIDSAEDHHKV